MRNRILVIVGSVLILSCGVADEPMQSVNEIMLEKITPATNTLWGIEEPQTDDDWQVFVDAAIVVVETSKSIKLGGAGPNDNSWARDPAWQAFADKLIAAGTDAREAAENKDLDAMFAAGDVLYPPCEDCHKQFHPGLQQN